MQIPCGQRSRDNAARQLRQVMMLVLVITLLCGWSAAVVLAAPVRSGTVTVSVEPADIAAKAGDRFDVNITMSGAQDLGAFELSLHYDPALVQIDKISLGKFIGSTDRAVIPLGPTIDPVKGLVVAGGLTTGVLPGAQGQGVLVMMSCTALRAGQGQLALTGLRASDTAGKAIDVSGVDGKVTFTGDVVVPTATPAPVTPTATFVPPPATAMTFPTLEATATAAPKGTSASEPGPTVAATPIPLETLMVVAATQTAQVRRTAEAQSTPTSTATAMPATETPGGAAPTSVQAPATSAATTPQAPSAGTSEAPTPGSSAGLAIGIGIAAVAVGAGGVYLWRRGRHKSS